MTYVVGARGAGCAPCPHIPPLWARRARPGLRACAARGRAAPHVLLTGVARRPPPAARARAWAASSQDAPRRGAHFGREGTALTAVFSLTCH